MKRFVVQQMSLVVFAVLIVLAPVPLCAQEPTMEFFSGGIVTPKSWIGWAGAVKSLSGGLYKDGWRVRAAAAYGRYEFSSDDQPNTANPALFELMAGYQFKAGPFISKIYGGLHGEQHRFARPDPGNRLTEMGYGFKLLSENWLDLPAHSFLSADASFSTLNNSYLGLLRLGSSHILSWMSIGPETQIVGNKESCQFRLGAFARWKLPRGSLEGNAGYMLDYDKKSATYLGMSFLQKF